ncbi:EpsI family protein [Lentisphaera marina]|uniref:exosortase C-terminal domain/associated protein EpsI n=1 Tax=Lentisphaera marina TaxID=1111041 RepID=UPI0023656938|nr:exosortase C-terminal domain/associated protein EpsI [Lentisphaera marina]MDD7986131.1 EpsI family protein [Lentisphaera marina]
MTRKKQVVGALSSGALMYLLLSICEPILNFPLRQFSSNFSYAFLQLFIEDISLSGTIISSHGIKFDVVPACSGSSTLKYILTFGTILCVMSRKICLKNCFYYLLTLVLMALCFNSLRISTLIILGIYNDAPIEGALHSVVGLIWFFVSMMSIHFFMGLKELSSNDTQEKKQGFRKELVIALCYLTLFYPFFSDTLDAWLDSPLDKFSWVFFILALYLVRLTSKNLTYKSSFINGGLIAFNHVQVMIITALFFDMNTLWMMAFLFLLSAYLIQYKGLKNLYLFIPAFVVLSCAFPASTYVIATYMPLGSSYQVDPLVIKLLISVLMFAIYYSIRPKEKVDVPRFEALSRIKHSYLLIVIYAAFSLVLTSEKSEFKQAYPSYVIGPWTGEKRDVPAYLINFFENGNVICRNYTSGNKDVQLMVSVHSSERHSMHSPEYCLKGANWDIVDSEIRQFPKGHQVKLVRAEKGKEKYYYAYWFSQNGEFYTDMLKVLKEDINLRLRGQQGHWVLSRVKAQDKEQIINFLKYFMAEKSNNELALNKTLIDKGVQQ